jgi:hypothetical protein
MTMVPPNFWTIRNNPPPDLGNHLNGLRIRKIDGGYELKVPNVAQPLASVAASAPPFDFQNVVVGDVIFDRIHVSALPSNGADGKGKWKVLKGKKPTGDPTEDGSFTAQAGAGADDDAEAASSAYA